MANPTINPTDGTLIQFTENESDIIIRTREWLKDEDNDSTRTALWICDFVMPVLFFTSLAILLTTDHDGYIPGTKELLSNSASASSAGAIVIYSILGLSALVSLVLLSISAMYFLGKNRTPTAEKENARLHSMFNYGYKSIKILNDGAMPYESTDTLGELKNKFKNLSSYLGEIITEVYIFCDNALILCEYRFKDSKERTNAEIKFNKMNESISKLIYLQTIINDPNCNFEKNDLFNFCASAWNEVRQNLWNVLSFVNKFDITGKISMSNYNFNESCEREKLKKSDLITDANKNMKKINDEVDSLISLSQTLSQELNEQEPTTASHEELNGQEPPVSPPLTVLTESTSTSLDGQTPSRIS